MEGELNFEKHKGKEKEDKKQMSYEVVEIDGDVGGAHVKEDGGVRNDRQR